MANLTIKMFFTLAFLYNVGLSLHFASYTIFLQSRGMNLWNMNMVNVFFMLLSAFLEMPTGAFADKFGRKNSVIASCTISAISTIVYYFSNNFWEFVIAEIIGAFAITLYNGAMQAWLFDSLRHHAYSGDINEVQRKENQWSLIGQICGSVLGGYIAMIDIAYPWIFSTLGSVVVAVFCVFLTNEKYREDKQFEKHTDSVFVIAFGTLRNGFKNKFLLYIGMFEFFLIASFQGFNMQWSILFKDGYGVNMWQMGWIMGIILFALFIGSRISISIMNHYQSKGIGIVISQIPTAIFMFLTAIIPDFSIALPFFFLHEITRGIFNPLRTIYVNKHGESKVRATVHSFNGMMNKFGATAGLLFSGIIAQTWSIKTCWIASSCLLFLTTLIFIKFKPNENW